MLFPQGVLPLRVFEARYMDMVRDCMRDETSFGVCLIADGKGANTNGSPATADVGCLARITAWDMQQLGLLQIRTVGGDRFRLLASESQPNGLMIGEIDLIEADEDQPSSGRASAVRRLADAHHRRHERAASRKATHR